MVYQIRPELSPAKKALIFGAFTAVVGGPILFGLGGGPVQAQAPQVAAAVRVTAAPFSSTAELVQGQRGQSPRPNPQPTPAPAAVIPRPVTEPANWMNTEVSMIATTEEIAAFNTLRFDEERQAFITNFWLRRDPTPNTAANEFETEFYRRVDFANDHFSRGGAEQMTAGRCTF